MSVLLSTKFLNVSHNDKFKSAVFQPSNKQASRPDLMSSDHWPAKASFKGLLDPPHGSALQAANMAYVQYCTSDAHMGNAGARIIDTPIVSCSQAPDE